jgi:hypothetical protein
MTLESAAQFLAKPSQWVDPEAATTPRVSICKQQSIFSEAKRASERGPRSRSDCKTRRRQRRRHQHAYFVGRKRPCAEPTLVHDCSSFDAGAWAALVDALASSDGRLPLVGAGAPMSSEAITWPCPRRLLHRLQRSGQGGGLRIATDCLAVHGPPSAGDPFADANGHGTGMPRRRRRIMSFRGSETELRLLCLCRRGVRPVFCIRANAQ